jgi:hypothetical protein
MTARPIRYAASVAAMFALACSETGSVTAPDRAGGFAAKPAPTADPTAIRAYPTDDANLAIRSDGRFVSDGASLYADGVCGVKNVIFIGNGGGDNVLQTDNPRYKDRSCPGGIRQMTVVYPDDHTETGPVGSNLGNLQTATSWIAIGDTAKRSLNVALAISGARCNALRYAAVTQDGVPISADSVNVRRIDPRTWEVWADAGDAPAYCTSTGEIYDMPVRFLVIASKDLPG